MVIYPFRDSQKKTLGYEWDKTFKRTDPRVWKRSRRDRYRRNDGGHPLDPLNYQTEERIVHYKRHRGIIQLLLYNFSSLKGLRQNS